MWRMFERTATQNSYIRTSARKSGYRQLIDEDCRRLARLGPAGQMQPPFCEGGSGLSSRYLKEDISLGGFLGLRQLTVPRSNCSAWFETGNIARSSLGNIFGCDLNRKNTELLS